MGGTNVKGLPEERAVQLATYMIESGATVRQTASKFGVSKSTVHKDITTRLCSLNPALFQQVQKVLCVNKSERHIRGGIATREKYKHEKEVKKVTLKNESDLTVEKFL